MWWVYSHLSKIPLLNCSLDSCLIWDLLLAESCLSQFHPLHFYTKTAYILNSSCSESWLPSRRLVGSPFPTLCAFKEIKTYLLSRHYKALAFALNEAYIYFVFKLTSVLQREYFSLVCAYSHIEMSAYWEKKSLNDSHAYCKLMHILVGLKYVFLTILTSLKVFRNCKSKLYLHIHWTLLLIFFGKKILWSRVTKSVSKFIHLMGKLMKPVEIKRFSLHWITTSYYGDNLFMLYCLHAHSLSSFEFECFHN